MHGYRSLVRARALLGALVSFAALLMLSAACGSDPSIIASAGDPGGEPAAEQPDTGTDGDGDDFGEGGDDTTDGPVPTTPPLRSSEQDEPSEPSSDMGAEPAPPATVVAAPGDASDPSVAVEPLPSPTPDILAVEVPTPEANGRTDAPTLQRAPAVDSGADNGIDNGVDDGWQRIESSAELLNPRPVQPAELLTSADEQTVLVRFWNGVEPCSVARVTVTELANVVEVLLEVGPHPNAAAMTCIEIAVAYEIAVPLAKPLSGRQLVATMNSAGAPHEEPPTLVPGDEAVFPVDQYLGLTLEDAEALAAIEERPFRVGRIDDEFFPMTMDFQPKRVTVEIEAGIVVAALGG